VATISKLSDKCKKCPHVNDCDNKRMMACALIQYKPNRIDAMAPITMPHTQPISRVVNPITINMGEHGTINTPLEEIAEKIKKDLYKNLNCSFNK